MDLFYFLQADTSHTAAATAASLQSTWDILVKGGVLMIPLGLLFATAIYFFIERMITLRKSGKIEDNFMNIIRDQIVTGNITAARSLAKNTDNPVARVIDKGIQRIGKPIDTIEKSMTNVGELEMYKMEKNVSILSVISRIAPLLGFLGTIAGMLTLFKSLAGQAEPSFNTIADGIYVKMTTSAVGLIIGILSYVGYSILQNKINKIANKMDGASAEFIDILQEPTK